MKIKWVFVIALAFILSCNKPLDPDPNFHLFPELALTPPMGWNSWNWFGCNINEDIIKEVAYSIANNGMKEAGYEYIVIDDCWQVSRDSDGNLVEDFERFPSGIKALSEYIHSLGLKFGIYTSVGTKTCQGFPGSRDYEEKDIRKFISWEVDYIKFDWCEETELFITPNIIKISNILSKSSREIVMSIGEGGQSRPWAVLPNYVHLWRTSTDITKCFDNDENNWPEILDRQDSLAPYAGPGQWNDPDMLQVGNSCMNYSENKAHFSLYSLVAAPLIAGNDVRNMSQEDLEILTNTEVIAVNQDILGIQGRKIRDSGDAELWAKELDNNEYAFVLFNRGDSYLQMEFKPEELGFSTEVKIRDLWGKNDLGTYNSDEKFEVEVESHGVFMGKITLP